MGRVKLQLKKIENKTYRHITFAKRKSGLVKKAYELSTLCDVEVALIIFSPAGKLFLFDGKKRIEEIFGRYIELPARRRGWVQNQELIRRIIAQMSLEAGLYNHPIISRTNSVDIDSQLQEIQKEILICRTQLEDVEKKLQYFLRSPNCVKSMTEAIYHEMILEETLKLVHFRKRILEANCVIQPTSQEFGVTFMPHLIDPRENPLHAQKASAEASMSRSLNYNLMNWQSQNHLQAPRNFTDQSIGVLYPSRNLVEPLVEKLPPPLSYLQGHRYLAGNEVNGQPNKSDGYIYRPTSGVVNANFPPRMHIIQQGRRATTSGAAQCEAGSSMGTFSGNTSNLDSDAWFRR